MKIWNKDPASKLDEIGRRCIYKALFGSQAYFQRRLLFGSRIDLLYLQHQRIFLPRLPSPSISRSMRRILPLCPNLVLFFSSGTNLTTFTTTFKGIPALSIPRFLSFCFFFDSFPSPTSTLPSSQLPLSVCTIFSRWKTSFTSDNCVQASFRQLSREI